MNYKVLSGHGAKAPKERERQTVQQTKAVFTCPVCDGYGKVDTWKMNKKKKEEELTIIQCKRCNGEGFVLMRRESDK